MRLPIIKSLVEFIEKNDEDFLLETTEVLEHLSVSDALKDEELDVVGELLSNILGAIEVNKSISSGAKKSEAINGFMKRVLGSIDK